MIRAVHLAYKAPAGGAGRAAYRLAAAERALGAGAELHVWESGGAGNEVLVPIRSWLSKADRARAGGRKAGAMLRRWGRRLDQGSLPYTFSEDASCPTGVVTCAVEGADVCHLHSVGGLVPSWETPMLARQAPVVWTLHDMNPFTGGCHYAGFCEKYLCACGRCPQLGSRRWRDGSHGMWQRRKAAYQEIEKKRMVVVSPSDWLRHCAEQSALLHGIPKEVIPYGVDTELFRPMEKARARRALGLPGDERLVLFPAPGIPGRKGWENLQGAAFRMDQSTPWRILVTGGSRPRAGNPAVADLGTLRSESAMARAYAASDLVALPSREDNFPNTLLEAMACGRPVVAFATGGIPEIVRHGATGLLARTGDERELSECLRSLLTDPCACNRMGQAARDVAVEEYGAALQAERYLALYRRMLGSASP